MNDVVIITLILILVRYFINLLGKDQFAGKIYQGYLKLSSNKVLKTFQSKKSELRQIHKEKLSISAQDQYAKWTKLNRRYDKLKKEIDELEKSMLETQTASLTKIKYGITALTVLPYWYYKVMYRKVELFNLPREMFPWAVEKYLAFPSVSTGAIGVGGWIFVVNNVVSSIEFIVKQSVASAPEPPTGDLKTDFESEKEPKMIELD